jgi:hypothetical protein
MFHFCGCEPLPEERRPALPRLWRGRFKAADDRARRERDARLAKFGPQPGPYFAIEVGPLLLVCIDTGITNGIDRDQAAWLRSVSASSDLSKVLVTGKPLIVDNEHARCEIEDGGTVDEIVRDKQHRYVAVIGGDIHNYQRYPVRLPDGRTLHYFVAGGGGAFMAATHSIPEIRFPG